jgi:peptide/nickel transport system substrate-binding protein
MLQEVEQIIYDDAAFIPLHWQNLSWASKNNMNTEDIVNVMNFPYFGNLMIK